MVSFPKYAWSKAGPLASCKFCLSFAETVVHAIIGTNKKLAKCVRQEIYPAIARETAFCIHKSTPNFEGIPIIPDFDEASMTNTQLLLDSISQEIMQQFQLNKCSEQNPDWAQNTAKCLENPEIPGFMKEHCNVVDVCTKTLNPMCQIQLQKIVPVTCGCLRNSDEELKTKLMNITQVLKNASFGFHN